MLTMELHKVKNSDFDETFIQAKSTPENPHIYKFSATKLDFSIFYEFSKIVACVHLPKN